MALTETEIEVFIALREQAVQELAAAERLMEPMLRQQAAAEELILQELAAVQKLMDPVFQQQAAAEKLILRELAAAEKLIEPMLRQQVAAEKLIQAALTPRAPDRDHLNLSSRVLLPPPVSKWTRDVERPEPPPEPPRRRPGFAPW